MLYFHSPIKTLNNSFRCYLDEIIREWFPIHGRGNVIASMMSKTPISNSEINSWIEDTEHGLFHGLMTGYFAYLFDKNSTSLYLSDCLFHDFYKCSHGDANHAERLRGKFRLSEVVYSHHNPVDNSHPLIIGDRCELLRYHDYKDWIKWDMLSEVNYLPMVKFFQQHMRPLLEIIYRNMDSPWIRHHQEYPYVWTYHLDEIVLNHDGCWPIHYWSPGNDKKGFAAYAGTLGSQDSRLNRVIMDDMQSIGIIPFNELQKHEYETDYFVDHLVIKARIPINKWIFLNTPPMNHPKCPFLLSSIPVDMILFCKSVVNNLRFARQKN